MPTLNVHSSLSEIADECACAPGLMMQLGIDCTLHSDDSIQAVCASHAIDPLALLELILTFSVPLVGNDERNWQDAPLEEFVDYLIAYHHEYLRRQLHLIQLLADEAVCEQGDQYPVLTQIRDQFLKVRRDLEQHFIDEEEVMFPAIRQLAAMTQSDTVGNGTIEINAQHVQHELDEEVSQFDAFRQMTHHYHTPDDACTAYQSLVENLAEFERELDRHYRLEHDVLVPRALRCETELSQR